MSIRRRRGFTLVELLLVTCLLLVIVGLSVPLFRKTFANLSAKDASFNISKLINYAQEMAVLERKPFKIVFDFKNKTYQLREFDMSLTPPAYIKVNSRFGRLFGMPQGVVITGNKSEMVFYPDGHCDDMKVNVLAKGEGYSVIIKKFGNMAQIKEVKVE